MFTKIKVSFCLIMFLALPLLAQDSNSQKSMNLNFDETEKTWPLSWPCVAWPPDKSKIYYSDKSPFQGKGCLALELKGKNSRAVALNFYNELPPPKMATPISLQDLKNVSIAAFSKKTNLSLICNYYSGVIRKAAEKFEIPRSNKWKQFKCQLTPPADVNYVQFEIVAEGEGTAGVDEITLNPEIAMPLIKGKPQQLLSKLAVSDVGNLSQIPLPAQKSYEPLTAKKNLTLDEALESNRGTHPRLVFNSEDIAKMKQMASGTHAEIYADLLKAIEKKDRGAMLKTFGYVLTKDTGLLEQAKQKLFEICDQYWMNGDLNYNFSIPVLVFGYDWLYDQLTPQERDELRLKIAIYARPWYEVTLSTGNKAAWQFNHMNIRPIAFGLAGMALYGEGCAYGGDETAKEWANYSKFCVDKWISTLPKDGSYQEGLIYWSIVLENYAKYIKAYHRLTGENLFESSDYFKMTPAFRFYLTTTDWHYQANFSDCIIDEIENSPTVICRALAAQGGPYAQLAQWMADKCNSQNDVKNAITDEKKLWEFLFYNPNVKPKTPQQQNWKKLYYFNDIGVVASHSSWDANDTFFVFKCGPYGTDTGAKLYDSNGGGRWGHNHPDAASWQLFHRGIPMAIDVGYDMCKRTINHNTVMPGNFAQIGDGETWLNSTTPYKKAPRITKFVGDSNLFYIKAVAQGNYDPNAQLTKFDRNVYGIKGKWFVIVDELASDINHPYQWILNTRKPGTILARTVEITDDGGPVPRFKFHPRKGDIGKLNPNGPSRLFIQFFSPEKLTLTGQMTDIEKPIDTFTQVWRMKATTESAKQAKFIAVIVPLGPGEVKPKINYIDNKIIFDTDSQRTILEISPEGLPKVKAQTQRDLPDPGQVVETMKKVMSFALAHQEDANITDWKSATFYAGVMAAYKATGDKEFYNVASQWAQNVNWKIRANPYLADNICAAQTFADLYMIEKNPAILDDTKTKLSRYFGKKIITYDELNHLTNKEPSRPFDGRNVWWWCDALFMAPPALAKMYTATQNERYLNLLDTMYWDTVQYLYDKNEKLFFRDDRYFTANTPQKNKVFWSRGNGWVYAGLIRILDDMPANWPNRQKYIDLFRQMTESIVKYQQSDGLWRTSLNEPSWFNMPETSGSSFFCYGLLAGINRGYIDNPAYQTAGIAAWNGLQRHVNAQGCLGSVQLVASKPGEVREEDFVNYAQGAYLLAGSEIFKMNFSQSK